MEQEILTQERAESVDGTSLNIEVTGAIDNNQSDGTEENKVEVKSEDFAKIANIAIGKKSEELDEGKKEKGDAFLAPELMKYDYIPDYVYERLPKLLKDSCNIFTEKREQDVFLTGALSVLGGCFHNAYAYNTVDKKGISPNLFAFIVAPPASGKRALNYSKKVAASIESAFRAKKFAEKIPKAMFIIPANISSAGLIQVLNENEGVGIMVESEIDTLVNATKQEWVTILIF